MCPSGVVLLLLVLMLVVSVPAVAGNRLPPIAPWKIKPANNGDHANIKTIGDSNCDRLMADDHTHTHDRFRTRESFMKNVVNNAPFVQYPKVIKMLSAVEALFKNIESLPSASAEAGTRVPVRLCGEMNCLF